MANYPAPIGHRMAYDRDGTVGFWFRSSDNVVRQISDADMQEMNDEDSTSFAPMPSGEVTYYSTDVYVGLLFPEHRNLVGHWLYLRNGAESFVNTLQVSPDTTNGFDGTWSNVDTRTGAAYTGQSVGVVGAPSPAYRTGQRPLSSTSVKSVRWKMRAGGGGAYGDEPEVAQFHVYGTPTNNTTRLEFWHPTLDQPLSQTPGHLDFGDRPRGSSDFREFRVKNRSTSMAANAVTVGMEALTDSTAPTFVSQHTFRFPPSAAGAATVTIPSLGPGEVSALIRLQQDLSASAAMSAWAQRIYASAGAWA